ncbi:MAG: DNA methyltransferase, partial [Nitrosospira sp.]
AKELLSESGSVFVQISDENVHLVRNLLDEIFGPGNFVSLIPFAKTTSSSTSTQLSIVCDYLLWYGKDVDKLKYRQLYLEKKLDGAGGSAYRKVRNLSGNTRGLREKEYSDFANLADGWRVFGLDNLTSSRPAGKGDVTSFAFRGREFALGKGTFKTDKKGLARLALAGRLEPAGNTLRYVRYLDDFRVFPLSGLWEDTTIAGFAADKRYVVETNNKVIERCLLMTTDPGDLVLDPTCGSGTTAFVAEKWGRRWITCDTSRVAVTLAKQRLMTASYDYYELRYPQEGLRGGFIYKTVPHVTLKSIANNPEIDEIYERIHPAIEAALADLNMTAGKDLKEWEVPFDFPDDWPEPAHKPFDAFHAARQSMQKQMDASIAAHADSETLYDQPAVAKNKLRITGPFTVEAVPFPSVLPLEETEQPREADVAIARSGESARQHNWRDELLKTGIRGKGGQMLKFAELETLPGTHSLHASGTLADSGERVVVSFGPEHAALEQRQVEHALREAGELFPLPKMIVFCAFNFDPEAAKDIDAMRGITALKAQMNTDLLTEDLKKARSSNQSFWLMGQPDVELRTQKDGKHIVEVNGFDYFDTSKGELVSGGKSKIAMWSLDTDYDDRSLFPRQVFFPMAGKDRGWKKLKKAIRAELNEELLDCFHGTVSLPFEAEENRKVAVKIVDDRGIESLKVISLGDER